MKRDISDISKAAAWLITAGLALVPAVFGGLFFLLLPYQDVISAPYICLGAAFIILWGAAGYLSGRILIPFYRLVIVNLIPLAAAAASAGTGIYAFFFERYSSSPLSDRFYLAQSYIGFAGLSFPALIARYMMNITAINYNIFLIGFILLITPFAFCYINGFSKGLEIKRNVPDIDGKDKGKA